jgi:hypothetical protein
VAIERELIIKTRYDFSQADAELAAHLASAQAKMGRAQGGSGGSGGQAVGGAASGGRGGGPSGPTVGGGGPAFVGGYPMPMGPYVSPAQQRAQYSVRVPSPAAIGRSMSALPGPGGSGGLPALPGPSGPGGIWLPPESYKVMIPRQGGMKALPGPGGGKDYAGGLTDYYSGLKNVKTDADDATKSVRGLGGAFGALSAANAGLGALTASLAMMGQQAAEARAHVAGMGDEVANARKRDAELASYRGEAPTAMFAAKVASEGAEAGLDPDRMRQFQLAFRGYAGQHIGNKIDAGQAERLQKQVASYAVGKKGLNSEDSARLLGTIINKSKPGASDQEILGQYGQLLEVMQLAPGYTGPLLGQLSEVVGESVGEGGPFKDALGAGILLRAEAERNPKQASAYTRALLRGLRRNAADPKKAAALGITKDMDIFQQIEASMKAAEKSGDEDQFIDKYFSEIRQYGGFKTAVGAGIRGGAFDRARKEAGLGGPGGDQAARAKFAKRVEGEAETYRQSELATEESGNARITAAQREQAAKGVNLRKFRKDAEAAVEGSGMLKSRAGLLESAGTMVGQHVYGLGDRKQQAVNDIAGENIRMGLQGYPQGRKFLESDSGGGIPYDTALKNARFTNEEKLERCANELTQLRKLAEQDRNRRTSAQAERAAPPIPMGVIFDAMGRF